MEKFSQFRDRGSGIAPFLPVPPEPAGVYLPLHLLLFVIRVPLLIGIGLLYFSVLQWLPFASIIKKGVLWATLLVQGSWWQDLQIDGVKRGYASSIVKQEEALQKLQTNIHRSLSRNEGRLPHPGTIIAASFTSPLDCLYLAAIFDPIFTASYPRTRLVRRISLFAAMMRALQQPESHPPKGTQLTDLRTILAQNPDSVVVVLPECTTTNGRGILQFSPSLLSAPAATKIFPVSLRYSPGDITTPVPGTYLAFLWRACAKPAHCIRVRIAECIRNTAAASDDGDDSDGGVPNGLSGNASPKGISVDERKVLDRIGEALARLGRVKRVALGVEEKHDFIALWNKRR